MKRRRVRKPNGLLYFITYIIVYPSLKLLFRLKVNKKGFKRPEGAYIVLGNHSSMIDFLPVMLTLYPHRINTMVSGRYFYDPSLNWIFKIMGCFPKVLFETDVGVVFDIMSIAKTGGRILIFPEGRITQDGAFSGMLTATGKLIKRLGLPVVTARLEGLYNCMPTWRKGTRFGKIRLIVENCLKAEDTRNLSIDEINQAVLTALNGDGWPGKDDSLRLFFSRRLAEGLHNFLYVCPVCKAEFSHESKGCVMWCRDCGNRVQMMRDGRIKPLPGSACPDTIHEWYNMILKHELSRIRSGDYAVSANVRVRMASTKRIDKLGFCGEGEITLDIEGFHFTGLIHGETTTLLIPIQMAAAVSYDKAECFQIYSGGNFYMFYPENGIICAKFAALGETLYQCLPEVAVTESYGRPRSFFSRAE